MAGPDGAPGGPNGSGISIQFQPDLAVSAAAVASGMEAALAATATAQAQSHAFIVTDGSSAGRGHPDTVGPGGNPADDDMAGPDASDG
jgi:hypothetical protein